MNKKIDVDVLKKLLDNIDGNGGVIAPQSYFTQVPDMFVRRTDLDLKEKMVFIYLWGYASNKGVAFPSQGRIMTELRISKPTLNKALKSLEIKGGIYVVNQFKRSTGQQLANLYILAEINMQDGMFEPGYIEVNKTIYPDKKRIIEK